MPNTWSRMGRRIGLAILVVGAAACNVERDAPGAGTFFVHGCPGSILVGDRATASGDWKGDSEDDLGFAGWTWSSDDGGGVAFLTKEGSRVDRLDIPAAKTSATGTEGRTVATFVALRPGSVVIHVGQVIKISALRDVARDACAIDVRDAATTSSPTGSPPPRASATPSASPSPEVLDACALLRIPEVSRALEGRATMTPGRSEPGFGECRYDAGSRRIDVTARILPSEQESIQAFNDLREERSGGQAVRNLPGIGDAAFTVSETYAARSGTSVVDMILIAPTNPGGPSPVSQDELARLLDLATARAQTLSG